MISWKRKKVVFVTIYVCTREEKKKNEKISCIYTGGGEGLDVTMRREEEKQDVKAKKRNQQKIRTSLQESHHIVRKIYILKFSSPELPDPHGLANVDLAHLTQPATVQQKPLGDHIIGIPLNLPLLIRIQPGQNRPQEFYLPILIPQPLELWDPHRFPLCRSNSVGDLFLEKRDIFGYGACAVGTSVPVYGDEINVAVGAARRQEGGEVVQSHVWDNAVGYAWAAELDTGR